LPGLAHSREAQGPTHQYKSRDGTPAVHVSRGVCQEALPSFRQQRLRVQKREGQTAYRYRRKDLEPFAFVGIWEFARIFGEDILSAAIIVGEANSLVCCVTVVRHAPI
jgi:hypothetical protein